MTGAYSFFVPPQGEDAAEAGEKYKLQHSGGYRELVGGAQNAEGYHHSEQTLFHALFHYPELLYDALVTADGLDLLPGGAFKLEAVSIDVFTTRQACGGCMTAAVKLLDHPKHFMVRAIAFIKAKMGDDIDVSEVRKFVRFDCDYPFPSSAPPKLAKNSAILHAVPGQPIPIKPGPCELLFLNVSANLTTHLLDNGSALTYSPRAKALLVELDRISSLPGSIRELAAAVKKHLQTARPDSFHEFIFIVAWFTKKWSGANAKPNSTRAKQVVDSGMSPTNQLVTCRAFFMMGVLTEMQTDVANAMVSCACAATELGADMLSDDTLAALEYAFKKQGTTCKRNELLAAVGKRMKERIDALLDEAKNGEAAAENAARTIAVQYSLLDYYRSKVAKPDSDSQ